jgi:hypothetical protein
MKLVLVLVSTWCSIATAAPVLGKVIADGVGVSIPAHWVLHVDAAAGTVIAREDPARKDAAVLTVALKQAPPGTREEALLEAMLGLVKDVKPVGRDVLPGGKGQAVLAEGTSDGIKVKLGAIAVVADGRAAVGLLMATPSQFDALGGLPLLLASLHSLHTPDASELELENTFGRQAMRADQPDLDPARPAVPRDQIAETTWTHTIGGAYFSETRRDADRAYGYNNSHGNAENYTFARDGSYRLQVLTMVDLNGCKSRGAGIETGTYTSDGKTLVLTPGQATFTGSICSSPTKQERARITPPRRYQIGLSRDGRLIFVGTGCTPFPAASCSDHVRWEMTVLKPTGK